LARDCDTQLSHKATAPMGLTTSNTEINPRPNCSTHGE